MTPDELKEQFEAAVAQRGADGYIDRLEDREIIHIALPAQVRADSARAALVQVCDTRGDVLESVAFKIAKGCFGDGFQKF